MNVNKSRLSIVIYAFSTSILSLVLFYIQQYELFIYSLFITIGLISLLFLHGKYRRYMKYFIIILLVISVVWYGILFLLANAIGNQWENTG